MLRQRRDGGAVFVVQNQVECVQIGLLALAPLRLRNGGDRVLIEQCGRPLLTRGIAQPPGRQSPFSQTGGTRTVVIAGLDLA